MSRKILSCKNDYFRSIINILRSFKFTYGTLQGTKINDIENKLARIDSLMKLSRDTLKIPRIAVGIIA